MSDVPVEPMFANLLVRRLVEEAKTRPELEHAVEGTKIRHSDAAGCARKIGLKVAGFKASNPPDAAAVWVMWLGSLIGEELAKDAEKAFGEGCVAEYCVTWDDLSASGHLDLKVDLDNEFPHEKVMPDGFTVRTRNEAFYRYCVEYKSMGAFGFDKSIGLNRKAYKVGKPEGPRVSAKIQGALNALAADADEMRVGEISLEAVSKQLAKAIGFDDEQRILAEWSYTREEFEPWARTEKARFREILRLVDKGVLPDRYVVQDDMTQTKLNPEQAKPPWNCEYCQMKDLCVRFGPGEVAL